MIVDSPIVELIRLSRSLGRPNQNLVILAEGNASARFDHDTFWVKASGTKMVDAFPSSFVQMEFAPILAALAKPEPTDLETRELLMSARAPGSVAMPSVETFMHAFLLSLPDVVFVGHTHPTSLLPLLCLEEVKTICKQRLFPDEVVCCGPESAFVPYADPGLPLAKAIRTAVQDYVATWGALPKTIWLQNHGLIAMGQSVEAIESATLMAAKAAEVWLRALSSNRRLTPLSAAQVERIHTRPDEHYRQRLLWQIQHEV
jgi:L-ribulose-5-phosphate 4-epimerase